MTTRALGTWAVRNAILDAGLEASRHRRHARLFGRRLDLGATFIAGDLGLRLNFYMDVVGGGSSTEALIGIAIGIIEAGLCKCVAIFRAMNGYSQVRIGGTGARSAAPVAGDMLHNRAYGWQSAGQSFAPTFMRHMYDYGTTPEQVAHVKMFHSRHASNNPKAYYKKRFTVEDVINSRFICKPLHLLDCCVETDNATCVIVTSAERAKDCKQHAGADPRRRRPLQQAAARHALPARPDLDRRRPLRAADPVAERRRRAGGCRRHRLLRCLHLHDDAAARGLRLLQEGRGRPVRVGRRDQLGGSGPTTPRAAISARAIPTA